MKERPILFSAPMVRAILDGIKTQTRRAMKIQPEYPIIIATDPHTNRYQLGEREPMTEAALLRECPYGKPGDRLWVRESFAFTDAHMAEYECSIEYRADSKCLAIAPGRELVEVPHGCDPRPFAGPWKPSIHMPRWASRILLEIVSVRVERLNDCSDADALAEGVDRTNTSIPGYAKERYRNLWNDINGAGTWDVNPWVWVVEFKRVKP